MFVIRYYEMAMSTIYVILFSLLFSRLLFGLFMKGGWGNDTVEPAIISSRDSLTTTVLAKNVAYQVPARTVPCVRLISVIQCETQENMLRKVLPHFHMPCK